MNSRQNEIRLKMCVQGPPDLTSTVAYERTCEIRQKDLRISQCPILYKTDLVMYGFYMYAFNPGSQRNKITNPCKNSSCKGLCLLRPLFSKKALDFTCLCNNVTSSSRKQWCYNPFTHVEIDSEEYIRPSPPEKKCKEDSEDEIQPSQPEGRFKKDSKDEIQPSQSEGCFTWLNLISLVIICGFLIILTSVSIYFIFRRSRLCRNNGDDPRLFMSLTECEVARL